MTDNNKPLNLDYILKDLGEYGRFQWYTYALACYCSFIGGLYMLGPIFGGKELLHRCKVPTCDNDTSIYATNFLNFTIPWNENEKEWDKCHQIAWHSPFHNQSLELFPPLSSNYTHYSSEVCNPLNFNKLDIVPCEEWIYDTSEFHSTTFSEFGLSCDNNWMKPLESSMLMAGNVIGSLLIGLISDWFGRKIGVVVSASLLCLSGIVSSFSLNYYFLLATRFLGGAGTGGCFQSAFIAGTENIGSKWRPLYGTLINVPFAVGEVAMGIFAFYIRSWRYFYFAISAPAIFIISYYWILPESIRWLIVQNRSEEAIATIQQMARYNKTSVPENLEANLSKMMIDKVEASKQRSIFDVMKSPIMRRRSFILFYCWMVCALVYYGLSSYVGSFSGNIFLNYTLVVLVEIPSYIIPAFFSNIFGRKLLLITNFLIGGAACIIASFLSHGSTILIMTLSLIGKFGITAAFGTIFVYTGEVYPTEYRGIGVGVCAMHSRIGGITAPFIAYLSFIHKSLPSLIFGSLSLIAGFLFFLLPETLGEKYPQTLNDAENIGKDQPWFKFKVCSAKDDKEEEIRL